jgi:selenide,water dikinase
MTDVTGFGLLGHLVEMADGSGLTARVEFARVPRLASAEYYLEQGCVPGGTQRNFDSYGDKIAPLPELHKLLLCDPQTSGGLLIAVTVEGEAEFLAVAAELGLALEPIGQLLERQSYAVEVL